VDSEFLGLSLAYTFAEIEAMRKLVDTLDELLELSRQLFGTSAWLSQLYPWNKTATAEDGVAEFDGWHATFK
jgi:hypothetical protein